MTYLTYRYTSEGPGRFTAVEEKSVGLVEYSGAVAWIIVDKATLYEIVGYMGSALVATSPLINRFRQVLGKSRH